MELTSIQELADLVQSQQKLIATLYKTMDEQQQQLDQLESKCTTLAMKLDIIAQTTPTQLTGQKKKGYFNI